MRTELTMQWPAFLEGSAVDERAVFQRDMLESLHQAIDPMMGQIKGAEPQSIAGKWNVQDQITGTGVSITMENDSPIFPFYEEDTRPHMIYPRNSGGVLHFQAGGSDVFTRFVNHPGTKGHHTFARGYQNAQPSIQQAIQAGLYAYLLDTIGPGSKAGAL